ncbi:helix-turn-helix transcriptional regulator [Burkholderia pseudomallei]|uniref:helix-turn-helix transcriptional regulator n=1 Tax=Burkholderia pseudomallei TaxID=28450 RepID=UPI002181EE4E|nr:AlpA family phage regulatory protein [Burkholderia pseudomallei]
MEFGNIYKGVSCGDSLMQIEHDSLLRLPEVLALIPVSRATWYAGVKHGRFPQPVSLGPRCVAWKASEIQSLINCGVRDASAEK